MRLTLPLPDFNNIFNNAPEGLFWFLFGKGIDYLLKNRKTVFRPKNFRKKIGWFQIISLGLLAFSMMLLSSAFHKIHVKPISSLLFRGVIGIIMIGFRIFKKIEPQIASELTKKLRDILIEHKMDEATFRDRLKRI